MNVQPTQALDGRIILGQQRNANIDERVVANSHRARVPTAVVSATTFVHGGRLLVEIDGAGILHCSDELHGGMSCTALADPDRYTATTSDTP